VFFAIVISTEA